MKIWMLLLPFIWFQSASSMAVSPQIASEIGERIWKNECAGTVEGLTHWKKGEDFASFGIGHFIWYSQGKQERFKETFPALMVFLQESGVEVTSWLQDAKGCPWTSREEFYENIHNAKMTSLRKLLFETKHL